MATELTTVEASVEALKLLMPHPERYALRTDDGRYTQIARKWTDDVLVEHVRGRTMIGAVSGDDAKMTTSVGVDLDAHVPGQDPFAAAKRLTTWAMAVGVPVICHSSKSGKGIHVRTLFDKPVPVRQARLLYWTGAKRIGLLSDPSFDKIWPPREGGYGVLALPLNGRAAKESGGSIGLNPGTMQPLPRGAHAVTLLEAERMTATDLLSVVGDCEDFEGIAAALHLPEGRYPGLDVMMDKCLAVQRLREEATTISYEFWRSMASNFRVMQGGQRAFQWLSTLDPARYDAKSLEKAWQSEKCVRCENLDKTWVCPRIQTCQAKNVGRPSYIAMGFRE